MTLHILGNKFHPDENDISSSWQRANISGVGQKLSVQPQRMADLDPCYRSVCYLGIQ